MIFIRKILLSKFFWLPGTGLALPKLIAEQAGWRASEPPICRQLLLKRKSARVATGTQLRPSCFVGTQLRPVCFVGTQLGPVCFVGTQLGPVCFVGTPLRP